MTDRVDVYFDPGCPWTWVTTRWLTGIAERRALTIGWRPFSLWLKNGESIPERFRANSQASLQALRVAVRVDQVAGNEAVGRFYAARGARHFGLGETPPLEEALAAAALDTSLAEAASDESLDVPIRASMQRAKELAGDNVGSPVVAVAGADRGFFGPVLTSVPAAAAADRLWDAFVSLSDVVEFHELTRDRPGPPDCGGRHRRRHPRA